MQNNNYIEFNILILIANIPSILNKRAPVIIK